MLLKIIMNIKTEIHKIENNRYLTIMPFLLLHILLFGFHLYLGIINFRIGLVDTAIYQTSLWQAGQFINPQFYFYPNDPHTFTNLHFMPIAFIYGILFRVFNNLIITSILYVTVSSVTTWFIYLTSFNILKNNLRATFFAILHNLYFLLPVHHFYPLDYFAQLFIVLGLYYFSKEEYRLSFLYFFISFLHKEYFSVSISLFCLGQFLLFIKSKPIIFSKEINKNDKSKLLFLVPTFFFGILWFYFSFIIVMDSLNENNFVNQFIFDEAWGATGPINNLKGIISIVFKEIILPKNILFILYLIIPYCFISLIGFEYLISIIPMLLILILVDGDSFPAQPINRFTVWLSPFITISAVIGYKRILKYLKSNKYLINIFKISLLVSFFYFSISSLHLQIYHLKNRLLWNLIHEEYNNDLKYLINTVPEKSSVTSEDYLLPFLSDRKKIYTLNQIDEKKPDYILRDFIGYNYSDFITHLSNVGLFNYLFKNEAFKKNSILNGKEENLYTTLYKLKERKGNCFLYKKL